MTRTLESYFTDWEGEAFGFGYGSGERHVLTALKDFLALIPKKDGSYDYQVLEAALTPCVAWLLINRLCDIDILEYGTSPRFAWLTPQGNILSDFVASKTIDELVDLACPAPNDAFGCSPTSCNCSDPSGYVEGAICPNPFWLSRRKGF